MSGKLVGIYIIPKFKYNISDKFFLFPANKEYMKFQKMNPIFGKILVLYTPLNIKYDMIQHGNPSFPRDQP